MIPGTCGKYENGASYQGRTQGWLHSWRLLHCCCTYYHVCRLVPQTSSTCTPKLESSPQLASSQWTMIKSWSLDWVLFLAEPHFRFLVTNHEKNLSVTLYLPCLYSGLHQRIHERKWLNPWVQHINRYRLFCTLVEIIPAKTLEPILTYLRVIWFQ